MDGRRESERPNPAPLWHDDIEVGAELVQEPGESRPDGRVAVQPDLPGLGELIRAGGLQDRPDERRLGPETVSRVSGEGARALPAAAANLLTVRGQSHR